MVLRVKIRYNGKALSKMKSEGKSMKEHAKEHVIKKK
jgi:hypothetical protein